MNYTITYDKCKDFVRRGYKLLCESRLCGTRATLITHLLGNAYFLSYIQCYSFIRQVVFLGYCALNFDTSGIILERDRATEKLQMKFYWL